MIRKIKRRKVLDTYTVFPQRFYSIQNDEESYLSPSVYKSRILTVPDGSLASRDLLLIEELVNLAGILKCDSLIFMGDTERGWLSQKNPYPPAKKAFDYLVDAKVGIGFNGALEVSPPDLAEFLPHFFHLVRYNASLPYFHFTNKQQGFLGSICQYGYLHLESLSASYESEIASALVTTSLIISDGNCSYPSQGGKITL